MPSLFSKPKAEETGSIPADKSEQLSTKFWAMHTERIDSLKKMINIPGENECTFLWTLNSFNAFTFVPFCIGHYGQIDEISLSTYTINRRIVDALIKQVDLGTIKKVNILIADNLKVRMPEVVAHLSALMTTRPMITIKYGWNHSKITCIQCGENYLVLEGSGNWGENAKFEQYILTNSKEVYEFRKKNFGMVE